MRSHFWCITTESVTLNKEVEEEGGLGGGCEEEGTVSPLGPVKVVSLPPDGSGSSEEMPCIDLV